MPESGEPSPPTQVCPPTNAGILVPAPPVGAKLVFPGPKLSQPDVLVDLVNDEA